MRAKKYINSLLYVFLGSGVLTGFLWGMRAGFWSGLQFGLIFALGLSIVVALVILPIDFFFTRNASYAELDVTQNEEFKLTGNVGDVFQRSLEILSNLKTMKSIQPLQDKMMISARTKASLFSFGEKITLRFISWEKGEVKIKIRSEPVLGYTKIDYGKNLNNVRSIGKAITESLKTSAG